MNHASLGRSLVVPEDVLCRALAGEAVTRSLATGTCLGLDHVGTRVRLLLEASETLRHARAVIAGAYDVDRSVLEGDVPALVGGLLDQGLVQAKV